MSKTNRRTEVCDMCWGEGIVTVNGYTLRPEKTKDVTCPRCNGIGIIRTWAKPKYKLEV